MTFGDLLRNARFWSATIVAIMAGGLLSAAVGERFDERTFAVLVPVFSLILLAPLATVIDFHWRAWPTAVLVVAIHVASWWLLSAGFFGWTDAEWLDDRGFSAGSPGGVSIAFAVACCVAAIPLTVSTLLAPGLTLASGDENPVSVLKRLIGMPAKLAAGPLLTLVAVIGGSVAATWVAILVAFMGGGPLGLLVALVIAVAGTVAVAAVTATSVVWLAEQPVPEGRSPARIVLVCGTLAVAGAGLTTGETLDYQEVGGPLTQVEQDPMASFAPAGGQLQSELRSKRGPNGAPRIDAAGTVYERTPMVMRSFLLTGSERTAADEAASAARAAGWALVEENDPYVGGTSYTGTRISGGVPMKLKIDGSGPLRCPATSTNPFCRGGELRIDVSAEWKLDPEAQKLTADPMASFVPPGTKLGSSQTQNTYFSRDHYVPKPGSQQAVKEAADATAEAARQAGWTLTPFSTPHSWLGKKQIGGKDAVLRIEIDLLEGAMGTYYDDKAGIVKVSVLVPS